MTVVAEIIQAIQGATSPPLTVVQDEERFEGLAPPYVSVQDPLVETPALVGDGRVLATERRVQVDLWEPRDSVDDSRLDAIVDALDGRRLPGTGLRFRVRSTQALTEEDLVHTVVDLAALRLRA